MDCLRTAEVLMASFDGEPVATDEVAAAHEHCASCPECLRLTATLTRFASLPAPQAPADLVERLVAMSAAAAEDIRSEHAASRALAEAGLELGPGQVGLDQRPEPDRPRIVPGWWTPRFSALAAAAAVVLVALGAGAVAMIGALTPTAETDGLVLMESSDAGATGPAERTGQDSLAAPPATDYADAAYGAAPPYVVFQGRVWTLREQVTAVPSQIETAGVALSALSETGDPAERTVLLDGSGSLWAAGDEGAYLRFAPVVRTFGLAEYVLTSGTTTPRFGDWPTLPARFAPPTSDDGAPTFVYFGFDDLGRDVYVPTGGIAQDGFAIAPGTPPEDPAAGNPNWTWWEPLD